MPPTIITKKENSTRKNKKAASVKIQKPRKKRKRPQSEGAATKSRVTKASRNNLGKGKRAPKQLSVQIAYNNTTTPSTTPTAASSNIPPIGLKLMENAAALPLSRVAYNKYSGPTHDPSQNARIFAKVRSSPRNVNSVIPTPTTEVDYSLSSATGAGPTPRWNSLTTPNGTGVVLQPLESPFSLKMHTISGDSFGLQDEDMVAANIVSRPESTLYASSLKFDFEDAMTGFISPVAHA